MVDSDLAEIYGVETKVFNQAVKRNIARFPESFRFQLTEGEFERLRSQNVTSKTRGGRRYLPYAFTEQGVAMLSSVLRSETAIQVSISIMNAFVEMRRFFTENAGIFQRLDKVELRLIEADHKFNQLFKAIEDKSTRPKQGVFFKGEIYDAWHFVSEIIREAKKSIILVDNYVDDNVLTLLNKRSTGVTAKIYTQNISRQLELDLQKQNSQYPEIGLEKFSDAHDRFLIIDENKLFHFGASLKDLGKKWFAFSEMHWLAIDILQKLKPANEND